MKTNPNNNILLQEKLYLFEIYPARRCCYSDWFLVLFYKFYAQLNPMLFHTMGNESALLLRKP